MFRTLQDKNNVKFLHDCKKVFTVFIELYKFYSRLLQMNKKNYTRNYLLFIYK